MLDQRSLTRFDLPLPAVLEVVGANSDQPNGVQCLKARDISANGAFFMTAQPLPVGTRVQVDLVLSLEKFKKITGSTAYVNLTGRVVRTAEDGMAVMFGPKYKIRRYEDHFAPDFESGSVSARPQATR